ncbi:uncharacterized protein A1O9_00915 [Exophiala aquamarina CBS 119918]|uniref:Uncharacterized protein n=1 Tax=Exophiala aquamarina CBS 119918 TaxID=1182545 RepID=A0A072PST6_9EURO|nr:uncharacterized protein A1O9_00915 [Exophiala aquamarina CBS 119918]KEF62941.1 hypothetical protein A1O9_00915 [Exophiala aquamarina CBS 119918]
MQGTIRKVKEAEQSSKKRRSDVLDGNLDNDAGTPVDSRPQNGAANFEQAGACFALRDEDEKRRQRNEEPNPRE